jgi:hypothetical protein
VIPKNTILVLLRGAGYGRQENPRHNPQTPKKKGASVL